MIDDEASKRERDRRLAQLLTVWEAEVAQARDTVHKILLAGNAGGAIAALALIGTAFRGVEQKIAAPIFWVLFTYLVGVAATWFYSEIAQILLGRRVRTLRRPPPYPEKLNSFGVATLKAIRWIPKVTLIGGTIGGLIYLYGLTK